MRELMPGDAIPSLPERRETALVVGYAPAVRSDVTAARLMRPDAVLIGAKYAAILYPEIEHVWTQHPEQAADIRERAGRPIFIHAREYARKRKSRRRRILAQNAEHIDFFWPSLHWIEDSSGFAAALWARHGLGFRETILCGVPLLDDGYCPEIAAFKPVRFGDSFIGLDVLGKWRDLIARYVSEGITAGITSMSGWTREHLGSPC